MNDHPAQSLLMDYLAQRLSDCDAEKLLEHVTDCEDCLSTLDELWVRIGLFGEEKQNRSQNMTKTSSQVIHRIRRSNLAGEAVRFGSEGLLVAMRAMLRTVTGPRK